MKFMDWRSPGWILAVVWLFASGASAAETRFTLIPLGVTGGLTEDNLSAYLLAPKGDARFVCLDAGTLNAGIRKARAEGAFEGFDLRRDRALKPDGAILRHHVKAFLISHAHLDHIAGLVLNSTDDSAKPVFAMEPTLEDLERDVFNWRVWPNFTDRGAEPRLGKYRCVRLETGKSEAIPDTAMTVEAFPLSHGEEHASTAFLVGSGGSYVLYCGDTGPDAMETGGRLGELWERVAPLIRERKLKAILLEASWPDPRAEGQLFGHLTPSWIMKELEALARHVDDVHMDEALRGLVVVVTHIKPSLQSGADPRGEIRRQLTKLNHLGVRFVLANQGERLEF